MSGGVVAAPRGSGASWTRLAAATHQPLRGHGCDAGDRHLCDRVVERTARPTLAEQLVEDARVLVADVRRRLGEDVRMGWLRTGRRRVQVARVEPLLLSLLAEPLRELRPLLRAELLERLRGAVAVLIRRQA